VIIRVSRSRIRDGSEEQVMAIVRAAVSRADQPDGLEYAQMGRRLEDRSEMLVAVSVWRDLEALTAALGPDWHQVTTLPGLEEYIESSAVEHYETIAAGLDELLASSA
jgi:heme-degrading monooxygenase HmoA